MTNRARAETVSFSMRIPATLKTDLERVADEEMCTVAYIIRRELTKFVREHDAVHP